MDWTIPHTSGAQISVPLEAGARLFLMGRNGSGKSALILALLGQAKDRSVRKLSAGRQTYFASVVAGSIAIETAQASPHKHVNDLWSERRDLTEDFHLESRWKETEPEQSLSQVLFRLLAIENQRARMIAQNANLESDSAESQVR